MRYWSDKRQRNGEKRPRSFDFYPNAEKRRVWGPGLWRKSNHTSFSPSTLEPPKPSGSASSGLICAYNAIHPSSVNRP
jgi:hypothetical protein